MIVKWLSWKLRILEKRVERNLTNAELTIMWLTEKEKDMREFKALAEWKEEVENAMRRLCDIKEVRKEVLRDEIKKGWNMWQSPRRGYGHADR